MLVRIVMVGVAMNAGENSDGGCGYECWWNK